MKGKCRVCKKNVPEDRKLICVKCDKEHLEKSKKLVRDFIKKYSVVTNKNHWWIPVRQ
jgi:predicted nucleic acid-binding Zn ribbon protein